MHYLNEIDHWCAEWLRNLIDDGNLPDGVTDERSIEDIIPSELDGYQQCHFFAGIGIWSLALRLAGWPDHRPVWTGSCPCQPFSTAGKGDGFDDERHMWPHWYHLITECRPPCVMGEQVASPAGLAWIDLVQADMEAAGYTFWVIDHCAAGYGAPHIRQRLYWVAYTDDPRSQGYTGDGIDGHQSRWIGAQPDGSIATGMPAYGVADSTGIGRNEKYPILGGINARNIAERHTTGLGASDGLSGGMVHPIGGGCVEGRQGQPAQRRGSNTGTGGTPAFTPPALPTNGLWRDADWLYGTDGYFRPVEPGTFPLVDGHPNRVGAIHAYGNALNVAQATEFIKAVMS